MGALSDKQINKLIKKKKLEIIPFDKESITSNGYVLLTESFEISPG